MFPKIDKYKICSFLSLYDLNKYDAQPILSLENVGLAIYHASCKLNF